MTLIWISVRIASANWIHLVPAFLLLFGALGQTRPALLEVDHCHLSPRLAAVEHPHLALVPVNATVRAAGRLLQLVFTVQRTRVRLPAGGPLDGHAVGHRHLEHVLPAVLRSHFAGVGVEDAVAAAGRLGAAPARLATVSRGLTVLFVRTHHALPASEQFHLASGLVDVPVATADRPVQRRELARHGTVLPVRRYVVAGSEVRQLDANPADLDPEHALVQVRPPVGAAYGILIARASVLALATVRPQAGGLLRGHGHALAAHLLPHFALGCVDHAVGTAYWLPAGWAYPGTSAGYQIAWIRESSNSENSR